MTAVIIALVTGVFAGALVVWLVTRGQGQASPVVMQSQGEIKARLDEALAQVQRLGVIFANAGQRGRAGELVLENLLEATGMDRHRDFELQTKAEDGSRPDVVVTLAGRGKLVIDAKFPLDDFQRAAAAQAGDERRRALAAHAKAVAGHVSVLAKRDYPAKIKNAINFTVCFVPADDLLAAACAERPELFYDAIRQRVLIATPTTLVALLWGVAYGWQQDARARAAEQVGDIAAELHQGLGIVMQHLHKTGRSLSSAVNAHNALVGALDTSVIPQIRRLEDLGILVPGTHLPEPQAIRAHIRPDSVANAALNGDRLPSPDAQLAAGTTTVPVAVTTMTGSARTEAAEAPRDRSARQTTRASKASCLLRRPTAVTVAVASMTSPARTGARNCTSE
jgi:DNA recombination protein RmuC